MSISKHNAEGYYDLTAHAALSAIEEEQHSLRSFRPIVYISSPFSGDITRNVENARRYCRFAVKQNALPIAPHLFFPQFMDDNNPVERDAAVFMNMVLLSKCAQLWVFGTDITAGMMEEIARARWKNMTVRRFTEALEEVRHA